MYNRETDSGETVQSGKKNNQKIGILAMLAASLCFSTGGLLIKMVPWNPLAINAARTLIASVVIGLYLLFTGHPLKWNRTVLIGALCMTGVTTFFVAATKLTTAGSAILLQYTAPVWIILMMALFFRKKPRKIEVITILIVLAGIFCFFYEGISSGGMFGNILALLAGICYAGVFMLNQFQEGDALSSMFFGQLISGIIFLPVLSRETEFDGKILICIVLLGAVQIGLAYILFSISTKHIDPVAAAIINAVEPVMNPILVAVFYGETLGTLSIAGAVIVISGVLFYNIRTIGQTD